MNKDHKFIESLADMPQGQEHHLEYFTNQMIVNTHKSQRLVITFTRYNHKDYNSRDVYFG